FQKGLIKVVFATETLAAGINMPARTTIISEISKRTDDGHRRLTGSEFLQMSGRAGRRGMDEVGYVVTISSPFHEPREIANLATSNSDPLNSQFTPTYSMVLNLLQRFTLEQARTLILSSFGYYSSNNRLTPLYAARDHLKTQIDEISFGLCPYKLSNNDLIKYNKDKEKYVSFKRIYNTLKKQSRNKKTPEVIEYKKKTSNLLHQMERVKCHTCEHYKKHIKSQTQLKKDTKRLESIETLIDIEQDLYWNQFLNLANVLTEKEYIKNNVPTELGVFASNFKCENELYLVEVINSGYLDKLQPFEIAGVFCALISEEPRNQEGIQKFPSKDARQAINDIYFIKKNISRIQRKNHVEINTLLNIHYSWLLEIWAQGIEWEMLVNQTSMAEGDIVRTIKRTVDILRQVTYAPYVNPELTKKCAIALEAINREPITELI
ncbi:MAG: DEAD/DEAH box helicase, partial [Vampirovibrionia bacterium]